MMLALMVLRSNLTLLARYEELEYEPRVHMIQPYEVDAEGNLSPWPLHTNEKHILIDSSQLLTAVAPNEELQKKYIELVGEEEVNKTPEPVLLSEGDQILEPITFDEGFEEYEPRYIEE
jgi:hypothetical protein